METLNNDCLGLIQGCLGPKSWGCLAQANRHLRHFIQSSLAYQTAKQFFHEDLRSTSRFIRLCQVGRCRLAKHYYEELSTGNLYDFRTRVFTQICMDGYLEVAQWLFEQGLKIPTVNVVSEDDTDSDDSDSDDEDSDSDNEEINQLSFQQYANPIAPRPISMGDTFRMTCENGHLEVVQWLWVIHPTIDLHMMNDFIFRMVCSRGHLEVLKWLWSIDGRINLQMAFRHACQKGQPEIVQWLRTLDPSLPPDPLKSSHQHRFK